MNRTASKARRHRRILDVVRSRPIASQEALARALLDHGHRVTQSTLSRDLKELRILRVPEATGYRYLPAGEEEAVGPGSAVPSLGRIAAAEVLTVAANESVVVLRTQVGRAQGVAAYLDGLSLPDALATIAGDDTVLVIPTSITEVDELRKRLLDLLELRAPDLKD